MTLPDSSSIFGVTFAFVVIGELDHLFFKGHQQAVENISAALKLFHSYHFDSSSIEKLNTSLPAFLFLLLFLFFLLFVSLIRLLLNPKLCLFS